MCKLCDKFKPKAWNFCPICGNEVNIPKYNIDDTFEDLLKKVGVVPKVNWIADWTEEEQKEWWNTMNEETK